MKNAIVLFFVLFNGLCFGQVIVNNGTANALITTTNAPSTYAIVIGISKYKEVAPLKYADRDAQIFSNYLLSKSGMNLDSGNVKLFLNDKATINNIGNALSDIIIMNLKKGDRIIFYFAGHGDYDAKIFKDQALLLLYGAPHQNYFQNIFTGDFISTADLNSRFIDPLTAKGCEVMLIIDACHASGMNSNLSGGVEGGKITMMALQNMTSPIKIYSCQANQYSLEGEEWGGGRGLFSYVLMEGLYGMADADKNKTISLRELQRYLEDNVPVLAAPIKQDPIVKIENGSESIAIVDDAFLISYKTEKDRNLVFTAKAGTKGSFDHWLQNKDSLLSKLYIECDSLIGRNELDIAYQKFLTIEGKDSSSDASLNLRRNLSAALQKKSAFILTPMLEDVRIFNSNEEQVKKAKTDLQKAATLLGEKNFIYKNLYARILFLGSLYFQFNNIESDVVNIIDSLELSSTLEPNAPYTYYYLGLYYRKKGELEKSEKNLNKYLDLIPSSWWAYTNLGLLYFKTGNYDKAEKSFLNAIEISKLLYGPENSDYGKSLFNLGLLYMREDKYEKAEQLFNKAKSIREKVLGKHHMDYDGQYMYYLGSIYLKNHEYVKAETLLNESKYIQRNDIDFPNYYSSLNAFESLYFSNGEYEKIVNIDKEKREELRRAFSGDKTGSYTKDYSECTQFVVKGNTEKALDKLHLAFKNGYKDLANIQYDFNINDIRELPEFRTLLEKYFKKEELSKYPKIFVVK